MFSWVSLLHFAALSGHSQVVEYLLQNGAFIDTQSGSQPTTSIYFQQYGSQSTALHLAVIKGHLETRKNGN